MIDHCTTNNYFFYYTGSLTTACSCLYNCHYQTHMNITTEENFDIFDANGNRILTFHNKGVPWITRIFGIEKPR